MIRISDHRSIVGIDPTTRGLAFVFFENGELLDWGTRRSDEDVRLLERLLASLKSDVLVVEDADAPRSERRPKIRRLLRQLKAHAELHGIEVVSVSRYAVRSEWAKVGRTRKHAVAEA